MYTQYCNKMGENLEENNSLYYLRLWKFVVMNNIQLIDVLNTSTLESNKVALLCFKKANHFPNVPL